MTETNQALCELETNCCEDRTLFRPAADVVKTGDGLEIVVDLPGVKEGDVDVTVERDVLTIRGRVSPQEDHGFEHLKTEYRIGDYERRFTLPENLDREQIDASLKHGVLTLRFPQLAETGPKKVTVKAV